MQQPPGYQDPRYYQQQPHPPYVTYWTQKHVIGLVLLVSAALIGMFFFFAGFVTLGLTWCIVPFVVVMGLVGLILMF